MSKKRKRRRKKGSPPFSFTLKRVLIVSLLVYLLAAFYFKSHFLFHTSINGVSVGGMSAEKTVQKLKKTAMAYQISIVDRDKNIYTIQGNEFDYLISSRSAVKDLIRKQNEALWFVKNISKKDLYLTDGQSMNESKLTEKILNLECFHNMIKPEDASVQRNEKGIEIIPEIKGNYLRSEKVISLIKEAVHQGRETVVLSDDCYEKPSVISSDPQLQSAYSNLAKYADTVITYRIGSREEVVDASLINQWLVNGDQGTLMLDQSAIASYVQSLANKYNTFGDERKFTTALGDTVTIGGGDYGWVVDKEKEAKQLYEDIQNGGKVEREPIYSQTAVSRENDDIGNTYIEIDYTNQHTYYFVNGSIVLDSEVVTGNIAKNTGSPDGIYKVVYKDSPATLKGEDYQSDVNYFVVFAYNVGFHDAPWRAAFGGDIYKSSGSHGCINMPLNKAEKLFSQVKEGTPVIAYYRTPVVLTEENTRISNAYSYKEPSL